MTRKRLTHAERRIQIIEVAMDLFASKGFKGATTRAIARAAGVSEAIIFRHFATKEDLYDAIINYTIDKRTHLWAQDEATSSQHKDLESLLRDYARTFLQRNREDATFVRLMMYSALEDHKFRQKFFAVYRSPQQKAIRKALEKGMRKGTIRPVDVNLTTRGFFWALLQYCVSRFIARKDLGDPADDEAMIDTLVTIYVHGLQMTSTEPNPPQDSVLT